MSRIPPVLTPLSLGMMLKNPKKANKRMIKILKSANIQYSVRRERPLKSAYLLQNHQIPIHHILRSWLIIKYESMDA